MKATELSPIPDYQHPKAAELTGTPQDAQLVYKLDNGSSFVINSDPEVLQDVYATAKARAGTYKPVARKAVQSVVEAPKTRPMVENQYIDLSTLEPREVLRRTISAKVYDLTHRTNLYGMFNEKLNEDRTVAMARKLGLITTTHCQKHAKALTELRGL